MGEKMGRPAGENQDQPDVLDEELKARAERAKASVELAARMKKPALSAREVPFGGNQSLIDRDRYIGWLMENAPDDDALTSEQIEAIARIEQGIEFFNNESPEARRKFLESGNADVFLTDGMSDELKDGIRASVEYLKSEGVFMEKKDSEGKKLGGWTVDPDFASAYIGGFGEQGSSSGEAVVGGAMDTTISHNFDKEFSAKSQDEKMRALLGVAGNSARLNISAEDLMRDQDAAIQKAAEEWYRTLPKEERSKLVKQYYAEQQSAVNAWNNIPNERRLAYLATGEIAALAGVEPQEDFDLGSEDGQKMTGMLAKLEQMGAISFGCEPDKTTDEEGRKWRKDLLEAAKLRKVDEQAAADERTKEGERRIFEADLKAAQEEREKQIRKLMEGPEHLSEEDARMKVDQDINIKVAVAKHTFIEKLRAKGDSFEFAEEEYEKRYSYYSDDELSDLEKMVIDRRIAEREKQESSEERRRRIAELRAKRGADFAELQMKTGGTSKEAIEDLMGQYPGLSQEEASRILALPKEEAEMQLRLRQMQEREARGETAATKFEGETGKTQHYVLYDDSTKTRYDFRSKSELEDYAQEHGFDLADPKMETILVDDDANEAKLEGLSGDDLRKAVKTMLQEGGTVRRNMGESLEDYEARLEATVDAYMEGRLRQKREEVIAKTHREKGFKEYVEGKGKKISEMTDEELDELTGHYHESPEAAAAKLDEIKKRIAKDPEFADFIKRNGLEAGLDGMTHDTLVDVIEKGFDTAKENRDKLAGMRGSIDELKQLVGASFEIPEDLSDMSDAEVSAKLGEVDRMRNARTKFGEMIASNDKFKEFVRSNPDYAYLLDESRRSTMNGGVAEKILDEWAQATGDIVLASVDFTESDARAADALTELMVQQYLKKGHFKSIKKLFEDRIRSRYHKKAEDVLRSGKAEGRFWNKFEKVDDFLAEHRKFFSKEATLAAILENPEGFELVPGESRDVYRVRNDGDKIIPLVQNGDSFTEVTDPDIATWLLGLYKEAASPYICSERKDEDKKALKAKLAEFGAASSDEESRGSRFSNFESAILDAGDKIDYVSSVDAHRDLLVVITNFEHGSPREKLLQACRERDEARRSELLDRIERHAQDGLYEVMHSFDSVAEEYETVLAELEKNPKNKEARARMISTLSFYDGFAGELGIIDYGDNPDENKRKHQEWHDKAMSLLEGAFIGSSMKPEAARAARQGMRAMVEQSIKENADAYMTRAFNEAEGLDLGVQVSDARLDQLSHGNAALLREYIKKWNEDSNAHRFKVLVGKEPMNSENMLLAAAGLIRPTKPMEQIPTHNGERAPVGDAEFKGINGDSQITAIEFEDSKKMIAEAIVNADMMEISHGTPDEIVDAVRRWNEASEVERRLYLVYGDNAQLSDEFRAAAKRLSEIDMLNRTDSYGLFTVNNARAREVGAGLGADEKIALANAMKLWKKGMDRTTRERCVRGVYDEDSGGRPALTDEVIDAYELLRKYDILPKAPDSYMVHESFREQAMRRRAGRS